MKTKDLAYIALFTALIAICSWISIPATVPFTLQTFAVFLTIGLLGGKRGTVAILAYILLGAIGVPVFAGFSGGIGILFGSTGGYIIGFLGSALVMWFIIHFFGEKTISLAIGMFLGLIVCYAFGTAWFMFIYLRSVGPIALIKVLKWCILPFIIPDVIKIALALLLSKRLKRYVNLKNNHMNSVNDSNNNHDDKKDDNAAI